MIRSFQFMLLLLIAGMISAAVYSGRAKQNIREIAAGANDWSQSGALDTPKTGPLAKLPLETKTARSVGRDLVSTPQVAGGPLERIAALPQPTPPIGPEPDIPSVPDPQSLRWRLVFNAVATSAGILQAGETALVLPGIDAVSVDETCRTSSGASWPCGMVARTAFRNYLQGRALNCNLPYEAQDKAIVAECLLLGQDPAAWLVEQGWARTKPNSALADLAAAAKTLNRGIYGQPPFGVEVISP